MKFVIVVTFLVNIAVANADFPDKFDTGFNLQGLIVGGEKAKPKQFPYQVAIRVNVSPYRSYLCGATLISNQWILTVAHCTEEAKYVDAHLGALNRTDTSEPGCKVIRIPKENIINHEGYDSWKKLNDISLLKLPNSVELNEYIQPAKLPKMGESSSYAGKQGITSGWGKRSDNDKAGSDILLWIEVPILDNMDCKKTFDILKKSHICIDTTGKKSVCFGDSGGPLVLADGSTTLIGLTSFGTRSCEREKPNVFTRITFYLDWIKDKSGIANE